MKRVLSLLASVLFVSGSLAAEALVPPSAHSPWLTLGVSPRATFDVLRTSIEADISTLSVQFVIRATYKEPVSNGPQNGNVMGRVFLEHTLVLCQEDLFVTMSQLVYNEKNEHVATVARATVYQNPNWRGSIITETMKWACGPRKSEPPNVTPPTNTRPIVGV